MRFRDAVRKVFNDFQNLLGLCLDGHHCPEAWAPYTPTFGTPTDIGTSNQEGTATTLARSDHVHRHPSGLGFDLHHGHYYRYISNANLLSGTGSRSFTVVGRMYLAPIQVPIKCTIDMIGYVIGATAAGNVRIGLYEVGSLGYPDLPDGGSLLVETGSLAQTTVNYLHWGSIPDLQLDPGLYFIAVQGDDTTGTFRYTENFGNFSHNTLGNVTSGRYYDIGAFGSFPDPCPTTGALGTACLWGFLRVKSIP